MKRAFLAAVCLVFVLTSAPLARNTPDNRGNFQITEIPPAPVSESEYGGSMFKAATASTTVLGWWQFDDPLSGLCDPEGWISADMTEQIATYFHVNGNALGDPGCDAITPVNGLRSMWCGQVPTSANPWCGWSTLPGYGNGWVQYLVSDTLVCDTLSWSWTAVWDTEPGYDFAYAEYWDVDAEYWQPLPVNGGTEYYDGSGGPLAENFQIALSSGWTQLRYRFTSDWGWSDEDALWPTSEGAVKLDDIGVACHNGPSYFHDFEIEACGDDRTLDGFWEARVPPGFGDFSHLVHGSSVVQEDPCVFVRSCLWAFFDDPAITNYASGGWPLQGAIRFGPDDNGHYLNNEIWSPWLPNSGSGSEYILSFLTYRDLPLDNLQFYVWSVRSRVDGGCASAWDNQNYVYYGGQKDWHRTQFQVGSFIPADATEIQVSIGAVDMCEYWCGAYAVGIHHSHAPLFDQVRVVRVDTEGPQWNVRHIDMWQDNFPEDGTVTGYARADMAQDMLPSSNPAILPGDSIAFEVADPEGLGTDPQFGGASVYVFARVVDRWRNNLGVGGAEMESPDVTRYPGDVSAVKRYPYCGTSGNPSAPAGLPADWHQFRCDDVFTYTGGAVADRFCCDLMDVAPLHAMEDAGNTGAFLPTHVIRYFLGAKNALGQWTYWHRTFDAGHPLYTMEGQGAKDVTGSLAAAYNAACEFSILPDTGLLPGAEGSRLYVDDCDDRGGPGQLYFDWVLFNTHLLDPCDRFDVLGPSSHVGNSLASRVKDVWSQLIGIYSGIFWVSGDLSAGLVCDGSPPNGGSGPDKSLDWTALKTFMDFHPYSPSVYFAGDNIAEEWNTLAHPDAVAFRGTYMPYILTTGNHAGPPSYLPVSPMVYQNTGMPLGPPQMIAFGGCPAINDFDVMASGGPQNFINSSYGTKDGPYGAVMIQATPTPSATTGRVALSGFGFNHIRNDDTVTPPGPDDKSIHFQDIDTWVEGTGITPNPLGVNPVAFENRLDNAYPNPFNPTTTIKYSIKEPGHVSLKIYNVAGQLVRTLVDESQMPREEGFSEKWNGTNDRGGPVSSGVYFYKLTTKGFTQTKKMVLLK